MNACVQACTYCCRYVRAHVRMCVCACMYACAHAFMCAYTNIARLREFARLRMRLAALSTALAGSKSIFPVNVHASMHARRYVAGKCVVGMHVCMQ